MVPKVGDTIYVPSEFYIGHPQDDFLGGKATVTRVFMGISAGKEVPFVDILEKPGASYNWTQYLEPDQEKLAKRFGDNVAHPDPDYNRYE